MAPKKLELGTQFACLDKNGDGTIYDQDLKELAGMLLYPITVMITTWMGANQ